MVHFLTHFRLSGGPRRWPAAAVVLSIISFLVMYPFLGGYNALNEADFLPNSLSIENPNPPSPVADENKLFLLKFAARPNPFAIINRVDYLPSPARYPFSPPKIASPLLC
jgi:hypothetical protein